MDILTADLVDAHEPILQSCDIQFRQYGGRLRFHGPVRTIRTFEDNPIIKKVLSTLAPTLKAGELDAAFALSGPDLAATTQPTASAHGIEVNAE